MASELQQLGAFIGSKFDEIYDGVKSVGDATSVNGQTATQIKDATLNTIRDGVSTDADTFFKLKGMIDGLKELVNGDDLDLDSIKEISDYIKANKDLIDSITILKANKTEVYTRIETDDLLALKANFAEVYSKLETYTKSEVDSRVSVKANSDDVYSRTVLDSAFATKVAYADVKSVVSGTNKVVTEFDLNSAVTPKANSVDVYTKAESDATELELQTLIDDRYTKAQVNTTVSGLQSQIDNTYTKSQVDTKVVLLQEQITQVGTYTQFVTAFESALV